MSDTQFEQLVRRLESYARQHPTRYKLNVALAAALGYAYLLAILGVALVGSAWLLSALNDGSADGLSSIALRLGLGLLAAIMAAYAFRLRLSLPAGFEVHRDEAPRLFLLIDKLTNALGTRPVHQVLIVNELTAAIAQTPRLGIFGWYRNSLLIGLPLMLAMTPVQFRAVLAHEFGHLGRRQSRFDSWISRTRMVWFRLRSELTARPRWGSFLVTKFLGWYAPFFNAYTFVLARGQEYEADRQAARLVGSICMKDALAVRYIVERMMNDLYWPALNRRTITNPTPPASHLDELIALLQRVPEPGTLQEWMTAALQQPTGYADTHPALVDRLAALDALSEKQETSALPPAFPNLRDPHEETAATFYLGTHATATRAGLDRLWADSVADEWKQKHQEMAIVRARCQALSDKSAIVGLSTDELWEYACQMEALESAVAALPLLQQLLAKDPNHAAANLAIGRLLLAQDDQSGLQYLERAIAQNHETVIPACKLACSFLERRGNHKESMRYRIKAQRQRQQLLEVTEERRSLKTGDTV
ncbi:MAG: M48 family metallopeptidase [Nitrospira sp.]|nr:M48 family metallopeptidase [Nitrospira sp.]